MEKAILIKGNSLVDNLIKFFYSFYYQLLIALTVMACYLHNNCYPAMILCCLCATLIFIFMKDITPIIPLVFCIPFVFRDFTFFEHFSCWLILLPVAISLIAHFFIYPIKQFKLGSLYLAIIFASVSLFTGGFFSNYLDEYTRSIGNNLLIGPFVLAVYLLFTNYVCPPEDFDLKNYFFSALICLGILISAEIFYFSYRYYYLFDGTFFYDSMGWGNKNGAAMILLLTIPAIYYALAKSQRVLPYYIMLIFFYLIMWVSKSDGCLAILCCFTPFMLLFLFIRTKSYKKRLIMIAEAFFFVFAVFILCLLKPIIVQAVLEYLDINASSDNSRTRLYKEAWALFLDNPIFGGGMGYYNDDIYIAFSGMFATFYLHSTLFQIIGSLGIIGLITYSYYFFARYRILTINNTNFNLYTFYSFTMLACYGFIDTCEFSLVPSLLFTTIILVIVEITNGRRIHQPLKPISRTQTSYHLPKLNCNLSIVK